VKQHAWEQARPGWRLGIAEIYLPGSGWQLAACWKAGALEVTCLSLLRTSCKRLTWGPAQASTHTPTHRYAIMRGYDLVGVQARRKGGLTSLRRPFSGRQCQLASTWSASASPSLHCVHASNTSAPPADCSFLCPSSKGERAPAASHCSWCTDPTSYKPPV